MKLTEINEERQPLFFWRLVAKIRVSNESDIPTVDQLVKQLSRDPLAIVRGIHKDHPTHVIYDLVFVGDEQADNGKKIFRRMERGKPEIRIHFFHVYGTYNRREDAVEEAVNDMTPHYKDIIFIKI